MVFTDLKVAEQFKSIFEDMAVADLRVALLWAARTGVQKTSKERPTYVREEQSERAAGAAARASAQRGPATRAREIRTHFKLPSTSTTTRPRHARDAASRTRPHSPPFSRARGIDFRRPATTSSTATSSATTTRRASPTKRLSTAWTRSRSASRTAAPSSTTRSRRTAPRRRSGSPSCSASPRRRPATRPRRAKATRPAPPRSRRPRRRRTSSRAR